MLKSFLLFKCTDFDHTKLPTWCTEYYSFVKYYYSPLHVSSIKYSSSGGHSCIQAAYGTVTLYRSPSVLLMRSYSCVSTGHQDSYREWRYHMLLTYNYVLLKMSTWYSKHVEESNNIWRINNIQCITLVVLYGQFMMHGQRNIKLQHFYCE